MKNNLEERFIELRNENSKYSIKILELEQELQKTREQLGVAEAVLSVQCTDSALAYFKDKQGEGWMKKCTNTNCEIYPYYGLAPHTHDKDFKTFFLEKDIWPDNFKEDIEEPSMGTYYCPTCNKDKQGE